MEGKKERKKVRMEKGVGKVERECGEKEEVELGKMEVIYWKVVVVGEGSRYFTR